ncbi:MAG: transketolase [Candidatus Altiarchaeota archaeon]
MSELEAVDLKKKAKKVRRHIIDMTCAACSGHPGGSMSILDTLVVLYFKHMRHKSDDPEWEDRDRLVLCKGHAAPALYSVLAEAGYFPVEELLTLRKLEGRLEGHPCRRHVPGVDASTGSLGQGLSLACGMAASARISGKKHRVFAILGDGEVQEGQVWEAAMAASHYKLDNIVAVLDRNHLQIDGTTEDVMDVEPLADKWRAFGWEVLSCNGHDHDAIAKALSEADKVVGKPAIIIAETVKGKGVSFMEGVKEYHGRALRPDELERALKELDEE